MILYVKTPNIKYYETWSGIKNIINAQTMTKKMATNFHDP